MSAFIYISVYLHMFLLIHTPDILTSLNTFTLVARSLATAPVAQRGGSAAEERDAS
jgi:hypothetical protein